MSLIKFKAKSSKLITIATLCVLAITFGYLMAKKNLSPTQTQSPITPTKAPDEGKIEISGVIMNDFLKDSSQTFVTIAQTKDFHVFYIPKQNLFMVSVVSYPFNDFRPIAEQILIETLGISKQEACKLNVDVTTPMFANPDKAGGVYKLSFCNDK